MAHPLSIIASSVAVAQAGEGLLRLVYKIKRLQEAPVEVELLIEELAEANTALSALQTTVLAVAQHVNTIDLAPLQGLLHQYAASLHAIQSLLDKHLLKATSVEGEETARSVLRLGWAVRKSKADFLRKKLGSVRLLVLGELTRISS